MGDPRRSYEAHFTLNAEVEGFRIQGGYAKGIELLGQTREADSERRGIGRRNGDGTTVHIISD